MANEREQSIPMDEIKGSGRNSTKGPDSIQSYMKVPEFDKNT